MAVRFAKQILGSISDRAAGDIVYERSAGQAGVGSWVAGGAVPSLDEESPGEAEEAMKIGKVAIGAVEAQGGGNVVARRRRVTIDSGAGVSV